MSLTGELAACFFFDWPLNAWLIVLVAAHARRTSSCERRTQYTPTIVHRIERPSNGMALANAQHRARSVAGNKQWTLYSCTHAVTGWDPATRIRMRFCILHAGQ
jgi:GTP cyclohydrolase I